MSIPAFSWLRWNTVITECLACTRKNSEDRFESDKFLDNVKDDTANYFYISHDSYLNCSLPSGDGELGSVCSLLASNVVLVVDYFDDYQTNSSDNSRSNENEHLLT